MSERFASYQAALKYLTESTDYERMRRVRYNADTFSLERMNALLEALGRPQRRTSAVHITGTKGKGSSAAMIETILRAHGLKTGLYTSPHLVDMRERIQIDRAWITEDALRRHAGRVADAIEERLKADPPTYFEQMTAVAFLVFAEAAVDAAVLEVGLGGRLDATNVVTPLVSVITSVSIDHTLQLGDDLASIAREKAGIIKPGVPLVLAPQRPEAEKVILDVAAKVAAPLTRIGVDVRAEWQPVFLEGRPASRVSIRTSRGQYHELTIPLAGRVQGTNAACAVAAAEIVLGRRIAATKVRDALRALDWPGRMQTFPGAVTVILDGAHNADSLAKLAEAVRDYYPQERVVWLFACAADKDVRGMLRALAEAGAEVVFTRTDTPRAAEPEELARDYAALCRAFLPAQTHGQATGRSASIEEALGLARAALPAGGVIVACGSLYLVGAMLEHPERFGLRSD